MTETATVTLPDGRTAEVSGPTREAVLARVDALRSEFSAQQADKAPQPLGQFNDPRGAAVTLGSAAVAEPVAGLAGIAGLIAGLAPGGESPIEKGARFVESTREALTIDPANEASERVLDTVGGGVETGLRGARHVGGSALGLVDAISAQNPEEAQDRIIETTGQVVDEGLFPVLADRTLEATGSPGLATSVAIIPVAILSALGLKGMKGLKKPELDQLRADITDTVRRAGLDPTDTSPANVAAMRQALIDDLSPQQPTATVGRPGLDRPVDVTPRPIPETGPGGAPITASPAAPVPRQPTPGAAVDVTPPAAAAGRTERLAGALESGNLIDEFERIARIQREQAFTDLDLRPTRAQVTRNADDFQRQQELAKTDTPVRAALEGQNQQIAGVFDEAVAASGGRAASSTSRATEAIVNRANTVDAEISRLYGQARAATGDAANIDLSRLIKTVDETFPSDRVMKGLPASIRGNLRQRGIVDNDGNVLRQVTVNEAEEIRQFINSHFDSTSGRGRAAIRDMKDALDTDVFSRAGRDVFVEARQAKVNFEQELARAKVSKFDSARRNLVRDVLENKIDPDRLVERVVFSKSYRSTDLRQLRDYLNQIDGGLEAFDDIRAEVLDTIKQRSFIGPEDARGVRDFSRNQYQRALDSVGTQKMEILFTVEERGLLDRVLKVAKLREPVKGTALGKGPSAQAVNGLLRAADKVGLRGFVDDILKGQQSKAALDTTRP